MSELSALVIGDCAGATEPSPKSRFISLGACTLQEKGRWILLNMCGCSWKSTGARCAHCWRSTYRDVWCQ